MSTLFFALTALAPVIYTPSHLISTYLDAEGVWQYLKYCGCFFYMAIMALRYNTRFSHRVGVIIWLSTCLGADNKGGAANI